MHYAFILELTFDPATHAAIEQLRVDLEADSATTHLSTPLLRPHVSLIVGSEVDVEATLPVLHSFAATTPSFPLTFSYLGIFSPGNNGIVYWGVTATHALLGLHSAFVATVSPLMGEVWAYYTEGVWVPHCTIAVDVKMAQMPTVLERSHPISIPFIGRAVAVSLVEVKREQGTLLGIFPFAS